MPRLKGAGSKPRSRGGVLGNLDRPKQPRTTQRELREQLAAQAVTNQELNQACHQQQQQLMQMQQAQAEQQ